MSNIYQAFMVKQILSMFCREAAAYTLTTIDINHPIPPTDIF